MSLSTNVYDALVRAASQDKLLKTFINGNAADLGALSTTDKTNLVNAINEVVGRLATAAGIDDGTTSTSKTWSSSKTAGEIAAASVEDRKRSNGTGTQSADTVTDGTTNKAYTAVERTKLAGVATGATANATDASLRDFSLSTGVRDHTAISDFDGAVNALISSTLDIANAPELLNSINELAAALGDDANFAATVNAALANRVRYDAAQSLSGPQAAQARTNIGAASGAEVGPTDTNFVQAYESALV